MKTALIDVGGGLRGVYGTGVLDKCLDLGIVFDYCIGVSAGAGNISSYLSGQRGRNYRFYFTYSFRKEYMGVKNFIKTGNFFNLDYVYGWLPTTKGDDPLDFDAMMAHPAEYIVVASEAESGKVRYFTRDDFALDKYDVFKASSCIPFFCKPVEIDGVKYYDGALSDPVPVQKALDDGCDKIVLVLTRPKDIIRSDKKDVSTARFIEKEYPKAAENLRARARRYNEGVALAKQLEKEGRAIIIAPDDTCGVDTMKRSKESLMQLYGKGFKDGAAIADFLKNDALIPGKA
ncbi:MAG: patatin family protein [Clostridia bacterium]|nr:patatin family protein [Clostridia bacterium]